MKTTPSLTRKLAWIIAVKVAGLMMIWWFFIAPQKVSVNEQSVSAHLLDHPPTYQEGR
jgi:hypothetical protein